MLINYIFPLLRHTVTPFLLLITRINQFVKRTKRRKSALIPIVQAYLRPLSFWFYNLNFNARVFLVNAEYINKALYIIPTVICKYSLFYKAVVDRFMRKCRYVVFIPAAARLVKVLVQHYGRFWPYSSELLPDVQTYERFGVPL